MTFVLDLTSLNQDILSGHLRVGGTNPSGVEINANSRYLTLAGKPWLPVMGEFHFSRYPNRFWREELLKMKAGGVQIAATYLFWNHHEEEEGQFDWSGDRDIRRFVELCAETGLLAYPRIGPWAHGEARSGGFPDWLLRICGEQVRRDAMPYLAYVERFYREIWTQLKGLLWKDGGPVIGIQLENELIHNAGHIHTLKRMARAVGFDVPLYTMTGWGPADVPQDEVIPLFGGYPDAFWDRHVDDWSRPARKHYFFGANRDDNAIGADLRKLERVADLEYLKRYPFATCELGGGMQVSYHRRPWIEPMDVLAPAVTRLGSGSNLLGYYMYHGGSHPLGKLSTLQESQATGYPNDLPVISYDFQTALREYGQESSQYRLLRRLHLFLADFGTALAPLTPAFPEPAPTGVEDHETLRWTARSDGRSGYLFINTYQRVEHLPEQPGVQFELQLQEKKLCVPLEPLTIPADSALIWPFEQNLDGIRLEYATAQPVCRLGGSGVPVYVFARHAGIAADFCFAAGTLSGVVGAALTKGRLLGDLPVGQPVDLRGRGGAWIRLLLLSEEQSLDCCKVTIADREHLFLSPASPVFDGGQVRLRSRCPSDLWFSLYPAPARALPVPGVAEGAFTRYNLAVPEQKSVPVSAERVSAAGPARAVPLGGGGVAQAPDDADFAAAETWRVQLPPDALQGASEVFLRIDYQGDAARAYLDGRLVADDFYYGRTWEIGLSRFAPQVLRHGLELKLLPLRADAPVYIPPQCRPAFDSSGQALSVRAIWAEPEYEQSIQLPAG